MTDDATGAIYPALSCINDKDMEARCTVQNAPKVIWSIKATGDLNSKMCQRLREGLSNKRITLLVDEDYIRENTQSYSEAQKISSGNEYEFIKPFVQTSLLANELINLRHEIRGNNVRIYQTSGMRKDRYSSLVYNYWVQGQLELSELRQTNTLSQTLEEFAEQLKGLSRKPIMY